MIFRRNLRNLKNPLIVLWYFISKVQFASHFFRKLPKISRVWNAKLILGLDPFYNRKLKHNFTEKNATQRKMHIKLLISHAWKSSERYGLFSPLPFWEFLILQIQKIQKVLVTAINSFWNLPISCILCCRTQKYYL